MGRLQGRREHGSEVQGNDCGHAAPVEADLQRNTLLCEPTDFLVEIVLNVTKIL